MRAKIVAGNWKMNNDYSQTKELIMALSNLKQTSSTEIMIAPSFTNLYPANEILKGSSNIEVIAQNMHFAEKGAYTGEVSVGMLKSIGVSTVILGHSERRLYFNESDDILRKKVDTALQHNMRILFCCGEKLEDRTQNKHFKIVGDQINNVLSHVSNNALSNVVIAYEPVWAIGTGKTALPEQAQEMHGFIRETIESNFNASLSQNISILYGGSVNPKNAASLSSQPDVDGALVGGASLNANDFFEIVNTF